MNGKVKNLRAIFLILVVFFISFVVNVKAVEGIPLCFFKAITGFDCPGCGLVRSFVSISHGELGKAVAYNLLGPFVYLLFFFYLIKNIFELLQKKIIFSFFLKEGTLSSKLLFFLFISQWSYKIFRQVYIRWF